MIRTRAIISNLSYDKLVKDRLIPDIIPLIQQSASTIRTIKYPPFVYSKGDQKFSFFGMLWDYMIRAGLRINLTQQIDLGIDPNSTMIQSLPEHEMLNIAENISTYETSHNINAIARAALILTSAMYGGTIFTTDEIQKYVPTMVNVLKEIISKWNFYAYYLKGKILFNAEFTYINFAGHPDIVTIHDDSACVLDIKSTASFPKMAKESCLQILAYYAIMKITVPSVKYAGFVLPMQRDLIIFDLSQWDSSLYLQLLSTEADKLKVVDRSPITLSGNGNIITGDTTIALDIGDHVLLLEVENGFDMNILKQRLGNISLNVLPEPVTASKWKIGTHISKGKNISYTLRDYANHNPGLPCQMFLCNPRTGKRDAKTNGQIDNANLVIKSTGLLYFTHAAYIINLCANQCDNGDYWQQRILNEDIALTVAIGGKGVVVHTGARKHRSETEALSIMEHMVRTALSYATEACPLLLETPCNEGTEVCGKIEDLGNFFYRFTPDDRNKLGVCIDTCHVFSAGYDPLAYLQHWEKYCQTPIRLVHFNDSQGMAGCCKDRHASPGAGHIGIEKMNAIADWCNERNIPMVLE